MTDTIIQTYRGTPTTTSIGVGGKDLMTLYTVDVMPEHMGTTKTAEAVDSNPEEQERCKADAVRLALCWNALRGMSNKHIEVMGPRLMALDVQTVGALLRAIMGPPHLLRELKATVNLREDIARGGSSNPLTAILANYEGFCNLRVKMGEATIDEDGAPQDSTPA